MLHNMWHTCQLIMIVSLDIINNIQIRCHCLGFCNVTGTFIYFKAIKLAIATTLVVNVRDPFNFTTWNKVVYTSGYVITYIIKTTEPNHLILILNLANKSYFIIKVNFCHFLALFKNYDHLKVGVNSFWDTLYYRKGSSGKFFASIVNSKKSRPIFQHISQGIYMAEDVARNLLR